jgi:hypothetical protein
VTYGERLGAFAVALVAACGRIDFDPAADLSRDCALLLHMDEDMWTGATGEVADACGETRR